MPDDFHQPGPGNDNPRSQRWSTGIQELSEFIRFPFVLPCRGSYILFNK
jgi:hypothetical protein